MSCARGACASDAARRLRSAARSTCGLWVLPTVATPLPSGLAAALIMAAAAVAILLDKRMRCGWACWLCLAAGRRVRSGVRKRVVRAAAPADRHHGAWASQQASNRFC